MENNMKHQSEEPKYIKSKIYGTYEFKNEDIKRQIDNIIKGISMKADSISEYGNKVSKIKEELGTT